MSFVIQIFLLVLCSLNIAFAAPRFLTISDIHYGSDNQSGDGHDTGNQFLAITLNKFKELSKDVDFILNLGDIPTHLLMVNPAKEEYERTVFHGLFEANHSLKPLFYITGNNDSLSGNYQPFELEGKSPLNFAEDWSGACLNCDGLIIDGTHMHHDGYYSSYVIPGNKDVMLIALNTVQWSDTPIYIPGYPNQRRDALVQLIWLEHQLKTHHGKQLLIAMHVPPGKVYNGNSLWRKVYLDRFIQILEQYNRSFDQITLITSHTHMDEIRKISLKNGLIIYGYAVPGISRLHHNNPGMKIFNFNPDWSIASYTTYYTSSSDKWGSELYRSTGSSDSIFPDCHHNLNLAQCLNLYSTKQVCHYLKAGLFYGVKSTTLKNYGCALSYDVN